ncbi:IS3 family transposase [Streptomyces sp. NPDC002403]
MIHHWDAGLQYTPFALGGHLDRAGIRGIDRLGRRRLRQRPDGIDDRPVQETELIKPGRPWKTLSQVELATAEWIDWYCHRRLHGEIGHVPPVEYEANHCMKYTKSQVATII